MTATEKNTSPDFFRKMESPAIAAFWEWKAAKDDADKYAKRRRKRTTFDETDYRDRLADEALHALVRAPVDSAEDALAVCAAVLYHANMFGPAAHGMGICLRTFPDG